MRFDDVDQAVTWANDSDDDLTFSVWTSDIGKGMPTQRGCTTAAPGSIPTSCW